MVKRLWRLCVSGDRLPRTAAAPYEYVMQYSIIKSGISTPTVYAIFALLIMRFSLTHVMRFYILNLMQKSLISADANLGRFCAKLSLQFMQNRITMVLLRHLLRVFLRANVMAILTVTARGQVTFRKDVLRHLGVKPGE